MDVTTTTDLDWLSWVRKLGGAKVAFDSSHPNHDAVAGLVGPLAKSDANMPAYLAELAQQFVSAESTDCGPANVGSIHSRYRVGAS